MKKILLLFVLPLVMLIIQSACTPVEKEIQVTTASESALDLYNQGYDAMMDVYVQKAFDLWDKALSEDPEFFMAAYWRSLAAIYFDDMETFKTYADKALQSTLELSKGEELMKESLQQLVDDPEADVTPIGNQLVEAYPEDPLAYQLLAQFQLMAGNNEGAKETLNTLVSMAENPAPFYNLLGYVNMNLDMLDEAEAAFDKYLELEPDHPNPYDSKGDYFMKTEQYEKAIESFKKAYSLDSVTFAISKKKAMKAKYILDSLSMQQ